MKRALALILCAVMLVAALSGCTTSLEKLETGEYDKGAVIPMYISTQMFNFDPATAYLNDANAKVLSLLYVGLTDIDANGNLQKTLIDRYEITENESLGEYKMKITLKETKWSDGVAITASDVVYAWKRIIKAGFQSEAAVLLYDIKNARDVKLGYMSIDDFGATAPETFVVEIEFERKINYDQFLRNLSSPALVPLRESVVGKSGDDWAKKSATIVTSGPFTLKTVDYSSGFMRLERNAYYFLDTEGGDYADKYVIPYRLETDYTKSVSSYLSNLTTDNSRNKTFYTSEIPLDQRATYKDYATVTDNMSTHTYYFNLQNELFQKPEVRRALSLAIDRNKIADEIVVFAKPATGFIPYKVTDGKVKTSFREAGGDILSASANVDEAKKLLSSAGVSGGDIRLAYYAYDDVSAAIANYVKGVWDGLGFNVTLVAMSASESSYDPQIYTDSYAPLYDATTTERRWDVLAMDYQMLSEDAFSGLAPFAVTFSGNGADMNNIEDDYPAWGHVTGYASEAYNKKIEEAFEETDLVKRSAILHEAEKMLLEDMPVIPIVFNQTAYVFDSSVVSGFTSDYYGVTDFSRVKMKNYFAWKEVFETDATK